MRTMKILVVTLHIVLENRTLRNALKVLKYITDTLFDCDRLRINFLPLVYHFTTVKVPLHVHIFFVNYFEIFPTHFYFLDRRKQGLCEANGTFKE